MKQLKIKKEILENCIMVVTEGEEMKKGTEITCEAVVMKNFPDLYLKSNHRSLSREYENDKGQTHVTK